jgi:hypothetical protein
MADDTYKVVLKEFSGNGKSDGAKSKKGLGDKIKKAVNWIGHKMGLAEKSINRVAGTVGSLSTIAGAVYGIINMVRSYKAAGENERRQDLPQAQISHDQLYDILSNPDRLQGYIDVARAQELRLLEIDPILAQRMARYRMELEGFMNYKESQNLGSQSPYSPATQTPPPEYSEQTTTDLPYQERGVSSEPLLERNRLASKPEAKKSKKLQTELVAILFISLLALFYLPFSNLTTTGMMVYPVSAGNPLTIGLLLIVTISLFFLRKEKSHVS